MPRARGRAFRGPPQPAIRWARNNQENREDILFRNVYTWRSACHRGDREVELHTDVAGEHLFNKDLDFLDNLYLPGPNIDNEMQSPYWYRHWNPTFPRPKTAQPQIVQNKGLDRWSTGFRLHWKRVLAEGGNGVATLWEVEFENGDREDVVIKFDPRDRTQLDKEWLWHKRYAGAAHIVQARDLETMARQRLLPGSAPPFFHLGHFNISVLEYMCHGTLREIFQKVSMLNINFPNNALWQLWGCLVEGVAEVAYQKNLTLQHLNGFSSNWRTAVDQGQETIREFLEYLQTVEISHDVHFDLEETNILVSEDENQNIVFKLHDFGDDWSHAMRTAWQRWGDTEYWKARKPAKSYRYLPEQHTKEWDGLAVHGRQAGARFRGDVFGVQGKCEAAGRYGSWSNVFIIARAMECAITRTELAHPFKAMYFQGDLAPTYGWRVNGDSPAYAHVDKDLIKIIHRCMAEAPMSRPSLVQLLAELAQAKIEGRLDNTDETRAFWKTVTRPMAELFAEMRGDDDNNGGGNGGDDDDDDDDYGNRTTIKAPNQGPPGGHQGPPVDYQDPPGGYQGPPGGYQDPNDGPDNRKTIKPPVRNQQGRTPLPNFRGQFMPRGAGNRPIDTKYEKGSSQFLMGVGHFRRREPLWRNRGRQVGRLSAAGPITMRNLRHQNDNLDLEAALERHLLEEQDTYPEIQQHSQRQHLRRFRSSKDQEVQRRRVSRKAKLLPQQGQQARGRGSGPMDIDD